MKGILTEDAAFRLADGVFKSINQKYIKDKLSVIWHRLLIVWLMKFCWLYYIYMEFVEYLMIGSGPF